MPREPSQRALLIVLDSVGVGRAPDAAAYGDEGADTLGHLMDRFPGLSLPALWSMGLGHVIGRNPSPWVGASYGRMTERSVGNITERTGRSREDAREALAGASPLGRLLDPDEVAAAVVWLASPEAAGISGQTLVIDGGGIQT